MKKTVAIIFTDHPIACCINRAILACIACLLLTYVCLVSKTINEGYEIQKISAQVSSLSAQMADLEGRYISLSSDVTMNRAKTLGFEEKESPIYITKKSLGRKVVMRNEI